MSPSWKTEPSREAVSRLHASGSVSSPARGWILPPGGPSLIPPPPHSSGKGRPNQGHPPLPPHGLRHTRQGTLGIQPAHRLTRDSPGRSRGTGAWGGGGGVCTLHICTLSSHLLVHFCPALDLSHYHAHNGPSESGRQGEELLVGGDVSIPRVGIPGKGDTRSLMGGGHSEAHPGCKTRHCTWLEQMTPAGREVGNQEEWPEERQSSDPPLALETLLGQRVCLGRAALPLAPSSLNAGTEPLSCCQLCPHSRQPLGSLLPSPQRATYSMGNQSPQSCLTVSMSSWQRRRRWISLSAVGGTSSVIHTCVEGEGQAREASGKAQGGRGLPRSAPAHQKSRKPQPA